MDHDDIPLIAVRNGGSAEPSELGQALRTLESVRSLLESHPATPRRGDDVTIGLGIAIAVLRDEAEMTTASYHHAGSPGVMVRCPQIAGDDAATVLATICGIAERTIASADAQLNQDLLRRIVTRNDAICAGVSQARGGRRVDNVAMRPASPFRRMRVSLSCGGEYAEWHAGPEHDHWVVARHVGFSAYLVPNGSIHLHVDDLTRHAGPDVNDPISLMRLIADLPEGPPVHIPEDAWEPMF